MKSYFVLGSLLIAMLFPSQRVLAQNSDAGRTLATPGDTPTTFENPALVGKYQASITAEDLAAHLYFFASDFFEGRETATRGQRLAAEYLAGQYRKMGLQGKGNSANGNPRSPGAFLQKFNLYGSGFDKAELTAGGKTHVFGGNATDGSFMTMLGGEGSASGSVVFAGYGIGDDALGYNDLAALSAAGISYTGKWVMILADEPMKGDKSLLPTEGNALSKWTTGRFDKLRPFFTAENGPAGILVVGDLSPRQIGTIRDAAMAAASAPPAGGGLSIDPPTGAGGRGNRFPTVLSISADLANSIIASSGKTVQSIKSAIDSSLKPTVFEVTGVVSSKVAHKQFDASTENVLAYIEGSDPLLKDQFVVVSSHYDHIGMRPDPVDGINNGADDDGSGTVAVLEIAEAFQKAKDDGVGPRRSILFLNVTGEEKGLLGSQYYTDRDPIVPLEKIVTNLNIDMVGRIDPTHTGPNSDYVYIIGSNLVSQELHDINLRVNEMIGTKLDLHERFNSKEDPNQFYRRSDHWNFGKHNIPFIFFFTGTHEDYHGVDDEPEKIEYERMARIAQVIFGTAWQVANQDTPPKVTGTGFN
ncbi:MAG: M28 family peptidase [Bacteroidetes bacterium]|nr:M28 family peptidase [Bacteroidota bacterium]